VTTLTYPRCTQAGCTGSPASSRTASFTFTHDALTAAASTSSPSMGTSTLTYLANGMVGSVTHANGVVWTQAADPDAFPRPASIQAKLGATTLWSTGTYGYDASGNVKAIGTSTYWYDAVSRLKTTSFDIAATGTPIAKTQTFTYDPFGNLTNIAGSVGRAIPVDYTTNRLTTVGSTCGAGNVYYDAAGNLTCWHGNTYTYDKTGAVMRTYLSGVEYDHVYAPGGDRIFTYQPGVGYRWTLRDLDGKVLREFKNTAGTWTIERDYLYRGRTLVAAAQPSGEIYHLHPDHLGTPRLVTGNSGVKKAFHAYYPFGEEATTITQDTERMKLTGHERDLGVTTSAADDLDYMHARYANPQLGRFLSVDPVDGNPWAPQSWNRYAYVVDNPLNRIDPFGLTGLSEDDPFQDEITVVEDKWDWQIPSGLLSFLGFPGFGSGGHGSGGRNPATLPSPGDSLGASLAKLLLHPCDPVAVGASIDVSTINPFTSGGGGSYGVNLEFVGGQGLGVYTFATPSDSASIGVDIGASATVNRAYGSGPWEGDFYTVMGSVGYVTGGGFLTPAGAMPAFDEPGYGWYGLQAGGTYGFPAGIGSNLSRFTKFASIDFPCK